MPALAVGGSFLWFWAAVLGFATGAITKGWSTLAWLIAGMLAAYPLAGAIGLMGNIGEGFLLLTVSYLVAAGIGHVAGLGVARAWPRSGTGLPSGRKRA